jgi:integrase
MKIEEFLELYPKANTKSVYRAGVFDFLDCVNGEKVRSGLRATAEEKETYENIAEGYFTEGRDYMADLLKFAASMTGKAPTGSRAKFTGAKEFMYHYGVEFTQRELRQLQTKLPRGKTSRTAEKDHDKETIKRIMAHMGIAGKTTVLILASSGMRIGEALLVDIADVDLNITPAQITIRGETTKNGETRTCFISAEAKESVIEWLKVRDSYLKSSLNRNNGLVEKASAKRKNGADTRLLPFSDSNMREIWQNALTKAGLWTKDSSTQRSQYRIHGLRKFFRSQLALSCPVDIVEALMGHEGYLTGAYRRYTTKQMSEYYLKGESYITITGSGDIQKIKDQLQDTRASVEGYKSIITTQSEQTGDLLEKFGRMESEITRLKAREEAREPYDDKMTELMKRLLSNPQLKELIKKELGGIKDKKA